MHAIHRFIPSQLATGRSGNRRSISIYLDHVNTQRCGSRAGGRVHTNFAIGARVTQVTSGTRVVGDKAAARPSPGARRGARRCVRAAPVPPAVSSGRTCAASGPGRGGVLTAMTGGYRGLSSSSAPSLCRGGPLWGTLAGAQRVVSSRARAWPMLWLLRAQVLQVVGRGRRRQADRLDDLQPVAVEPPYVAGSSAINRSRLMPTSRESACPPRRSGSWPCAVLASTVSNPLSCSA
jgi:hypothetical protein